MIYLLDTNVCARYLNGKSLTIRKFNFLSESGFSRFKDLQD
jgi:hypothetical protein